MAKKMDRAGPFLLTISRLLFCRQKRGVATWPFGLAAAISKDRGMGFRQNLRETAASIYAALNEPSPAPAWKTVPSWFIYGKADKNIPAEANAFMAKRAHAKKTVVVDGASHVMMASHPDQMAKLIEEAAATVK